jgi:hypothetical protein
MRPQIPLRICPVKDTLLYSFVSIYLGSAKKQYLGAQHRNMWHGWLNRPKRPFEYIGKKILVMFLPKNFKINKILTFLYYAQFSQF